MSLEDSNYMHQDSLVAAYMSNILALLLQAFMYILFITVFFTLFLSCIGS